MTSYFSHTSRLTKIIILVEFVLVAYLLYSLTKNVYNTYVIDQHIASFEEENRQLEAENRQKTEDYLYFTSEEYIDKIAKQSFGLVNPGEEVIVLAPEVFAPDEREGEGEEAALSQERSVPEQWWFFFFGS